MTSQPRQPKGTPVGGEFATSAHAETSTTLTASAAAYGGQTPREVDEQLAERYDALGKAEDRRARLVDDAHYLLGHRKSYAGSRSGRWPKGAEETLAELREAVDAGRLKSWDEASARRALDGLAEVDTDRARLAGEMKDLEGEFRARGGWSRFFLVTSSTGGHIHASMGCHTCKTTTRFGWLPQLSGKSEPDAVAEHGAILCTACYPSAPVEWTRGKDPAPDTCPGSSQQPSAGFRRVGRSMYGECPVCGDTQTVTYSGIRKHKRKA